MYASISACGSGRSVATRTPRSITPRPATRRPWPRTPAPGGRDGEGIVALVTGGPGVGKTLLCHCLLERLGPRRALSVFLPNSHFADRAGLVPGHLSTTCRMPTATRHRTGAALAVTEHLLQN